MAKKSDLQIVKEKALKYAEIVKLNIKVQKMYLFGSYVKGTNHIYSDIDIAVVSNDFKGDCIDDPVMLMMYCRDIDLMIEPHAFFPKDFNKKNPFTKEIIETGIRLI
jgi:predicted nucleotidyltransferase